MVVKTATYVPFEDFEVWQFLKIAQCATFFGLWDDKIKDFSRRSLFRVFATGYHASRGISWGKVISLTKKFYSFLYHFWRLSNFFVVLQIASIRCVKTPIYVCRKKNWEKVTLRKLLFYQFRTLSRKNLDFQQNSKTWFSKL